MSTLEESVEEDDDTEAGQGKQRRQQSPPAESESAAIPAVVGKRGSSVGAAAAAAAADADASSGGGGGAGAGRRGSVSSSPVRGHPRGRRATAGSVKSGSPKRSAAIVRRQSVSKVGSGRGAFTLFVLLLLS